VSSDPTAGLASIAAALADRYRIERELGQGGMATVYLAEDLKHGRRVAIKVLRPELAAVIGAERFVREIRTIAALQHSHILGLIDSGEAGGTAYYVMPYVDGGTLRDRLRREGQLPIDDALRIAREVSLALDYAHRRGLVHRDIKPENILLTAEGEALVADFGIARLLDSTDDALTQTGISLGTPAYMSPEQATGDKHVDQRSDIYALGAVLYEMLAGEPPFTGPNPQAIIAKRFSTAAPSVRVLRPETPAAVEAAVARALARVPADRFAGAADFAAALTQRLTPAATTVLETTPPTRRRAAPAGWLMLVIGFAIGLGVLFAWRRESGRRPGRDHHLVLAPTFENKSADAAFDPVIARVVASVRGGLAEVDSVQVLDEPEGRQTAGSMVAGALYREGDSIQVSATITDVATGKALYTVGPVVASIQRPADVLEPLSQRLVGGMAALLDPSWGAQGVLPLRPPRWDAYREFHQGDLSFYAEVEDSAFAHFARAAALDPSFNLARLRAAQVLVNAYGRLYSRADSALNAVRAGRPTFSPFERAYFDWSWAWHRGDWEGAYAAAVVMTEVSPRSEIAAYIRGNFANLSMRWREGVRVLETLDPRSTTLRIRSGYYFNLTNALHMLGEHRRELEAARSARERFPDQLRVRRLEIRALAALGEQAEFDLRESQAVTQVDRLRESPGPLLLLAALEARAHGQEAIARSALARLSEWYAGAGSADSSEANQRSRIDAARLADDWVRARELADSLAALHPDAPTWAGLRGVIAAHLGERAEAGRIAAQLAAMPPELLGGNTLWRARIAAQLGDRDQAVSLVRAAMAEGSRLLATDDSDMDLTVLRDYPPFLELTRARD
jgi:serine/threonine protein kinase